MNIEEQIKIVKNMLLHAETQLLDYEAIAIETLLTAYEKEKETSHYIQSQLDIANAKLVEEKEKNETQPDCAEPVERTEEMVNMRWVNYHYIGKEKLKARIEEYKNKIKKIRSKKLINEPEDTIIITRYAHYISVLQSLLREE